MQKYIFILFISFFCCAFVQQVEAQRFKAGVVLGVNASQIDGDDYAGYDKIGLRAGLRSTILLREKMDVGVEILYSQRGSQTALVPNNVIEQNKISLNYIEVPVTFNYSDWYQEEEDYYRVQFAGGLAYSRLFNTKIQDNSITTLSNFFSKDDISFTIGVSYFITSNWALSFRFNRSLTYLFNNDKVTEVNARSLLEKYLSFYAMYIF